MQFYISHMIDYSAGGDSGSDDTGNGDNYVSSDSGCNCGGNNGIGSSGNSRKEKKCLIAHQVNLLVYIGFSVDRYFPHILTYSGKFQPVFSSDLLSHPGSLWNKKGTADLWQWRNSHFLIFQNQVSVIEEQGLQQVQIGPPAHCNPLGSHTDSCFQ